jgi:hypothetical protein
MQKVQPSKEIKKLQLKGLYLNARIYCGVPDLELARKQLDEAEEVLKEVKDEVVLIRQKINRALFLVDFKYFD